MQVISIGTDTKILDGGRVFERVKEYAGLVEGKYYCYIFTSDAKKVQFEKVYGNFILKAIYGENKIKQIASLFSNITHLIKQEKKGIIWYPQDSFEIGLISLIFKLFFGGKLYAQCHTDISHPNFRNHSKRNYLQYLIGNFVFRRADKIRVVSQRMKNYLIENLKIDESKILSLPIYFDGNLNKNLPGQTTDFLIMSRLSPEKNIPVAIKAIDNIRNKTNSDLKLKIVGEGVLAPSPEGGGLGWGLSWVTHSAWSTTPNQEYQNAKYFLLPSLYEGWALTAIEAVNAGTPVIMTDVGCAHEFILNNVNGVVAEGFDVKSFQAAVETAMRIDWQTDVAKEKMRQSVLGLNTKQEYLDKLKKFLNE
jgi:glycosyltransferase involved in cell wall biosynthesis